MLSKLLTSSALLMITLLTLPVRAENPSHTSRLISTRVCENCDLQGAGLTLTNLVRARLRGSDLSFANLSRADLSGADLSGADLTGASLYGANLQGANLQGANLKGTDLREAFLGDANLHGTDLSTAHIKGAQALPVEAVGPVQFYNWGLIDASQRNYQSALHNYNQAIATDPEFAAAYLARSIIRFQMSDVRGAVQDSEMAAALFKDQGQVQGQELAQNFVDKIHELEKAARNAARRRQIQSVIQSIGSMVMQFLL